MAAPTKAELWDIWGSSSSDVFAVGSAGMVARYDGAAWNVTPTPTAATLTGVWGAGPADVTAVAKSMGQAHAAFLHYDGAAWHRSPADLRGEGNYQCPTINGSGGAGPDVYVVGDHQLILRRCPQGKCP
jgi:hypothetical protein